MQSQVEVRRQIAKETKRKTLRLINKNIDERVANSSIFLKIGKKLNKPGQEEYDTITEEGEKL